MIRTLTARRTVVRHLAAITIMASAMGLGGCSSDAGDSQTDDADGELRTTPAASQRTFVLDAPFECSMQDMTTLNYSPVASAGKVKITLKFDDDPTVQSQVVAVVASRPADQYRKTGKVRAGRVTVDVERDAIDGSGTKLKSHLVIDDLEGTVNADKEGNEAPYRLRYEVNAGLPARGEPAAGDAFLEDFWFTLYNLGRAGKSFTLATSAMREIDDGAKRHYCTAKTVFADPVTGQTP